MRVVLAVVTLSLAIATTGCPGFHESSAAANDAAAPGRDAQTVTDAPRPLDAPVGHDSSLPTDAGRDAPPPTRDAAVDAPARDSAIDAGVDASGDAGLDEAGVSALLALPSADAATCSPIGNITVCSLGNCLIAGPGPVGRCQTCSRQGGDCGGHKNSPCAIAEDCDEGWACYAGSCTLMCRLDAGTCGYPATCVNVGNAEDGVCFGS
jgi:hypothetical protein